MSAPAPRRGAPAMPRLRAFNVVVGLVHAAQAVVLLLIASDASLPVTVGYLEGPPGSAQRASTELFSLPFAPAVAAFLLLAAADHLAVASPGAVGRYERNVAAGRNPARWTEYSVSASIMVVLIAMLAGIAEAAALIAIFGVNSAMILFGLVMERVSRPGGEVDGRPFAYDCVAGAVPWIAIGVQLAVAHSPRAATSPPSSSRSSSRSSCSSSFAVNMVLQYRQVGRWRDPVFAEAAYVVLSLVAKSALAWQVYAGALAGG